MDILIGAVSTNCAIWSARDGPEWGKECIMSGRIRTGEE